MGKPRHEWQMQLPARALRSVSLRTTHGLVLGIHPAIPAQRTTLRFGHPKVRETRIDVRDGRDHRLARLEAVLFVTREPLPIRKLGRLANLADGTEARTLVARLNLLYEHEMRAFRVEEVGGGWQLRTRGKFANWLRKVHPLPDQIRLSQPASETLAVIAYQQPVVRTEVEAIRGVNCGEVIRQLMERDLVRVIGRSEDLGRPYYYGTTKRFLQVFGLRDLSDLPRADLFRHSTETTIVSDLKANLVYGEGDIAVTVTKADGGLDAPDELERRATLAQAASPQAKDDDWEEVEDDEEGDWDDDDEEEDDDEEDEEEDEDWDEEEDVDEEVDEDELEEDVEELDDEDEDWEEDDEEDEWEEVDDEEFEEEGSKEEDEEDEEEEWDEDESDEDDEEWEEEGDT